MRKITDHGPRADQARTLLAMIAERGEQFDHWQREYLGPAPYRGPDAEAYALAFRATSDEINEIREGLDPLGYGLCPCCRHDLEDWYCHLCNTRLDQEAQFRLLELTQDERRQLSYAGGLYFLSYLETGVVPYARSPRQSVWRKTLERLVPSLRDL